MSKRQEPNINSLINSLSSLYIIIDKKGMILYTNKSVRDLLLYNENELLNLTIDKICTKSDINDNNKSFISTLSHNSYNDHITLIDKNGDVHQTKSFISNGKLDSKNVIIIQAEPISRNDTSTIQTFTSNLIGDLPIGVFIYEYKHPDKLYLLDGNIEAARLTNLNLEQNIGREFNEIWQQAYQEGISKSFLNVMHTGITFESEKTIYKDGKYDGIYRTKVFKLSENKLVVSFNEISNLINTQNALLMSEEKYKSIVENAFDAIYYLKERRYEYANPRFCEITGYSFEEITSPDFDFKVLLSTEGINKIEERYKLRKEGKDVPGRYEIEIIRKSGEKALVEVSTVSMGSKDDVAVLGIMRDITSSHKALKALKDSEIKYRSVVDNANEGIVIIQNEKLVFFNPKSLEIIGWSKEEAITNSFQSYIHPNDTNYVVRIHQGRLSGEDVPSNYNFRVLRKDGDIRWINVSAVLIDWYGEPATLVFLSDISEIKNTEEKLLRAQVLLNTALEQSPAGIIIADSNNSQPQLINEAALDIMGISYDDIISGKESHYFKKWYATTFNGEVIPIDDLPLGKSLREGIAVNNMEVIIHRIDGTKKYVLAHSTPIFDENGAIISGFVIFQDISTIKNYESELHSAHEKVTTFIQNADDMIYFIGRDGEVKMLNSANSFITGYEQDEFENNPQLWSEIMHPDDLAMDELFFKSYPEGIPFHQTEYRIKTKSGNWKWMQSRMIAVKSPEGRFIGYNCIDRDITELKTALDEIRSLNIDLESRVAERTKQLEEILEDLQKEIVIRRKTERELQKAKEEISNAFKQEKELNLLKTRFISMISHEYRTPLTVILTSTYLLEQLFDSRNQDSFIKHLEKIRISVKTMTKLLEDVLTLGKSESGKLEIYPMTIDLIGLCFDTIEEVKMIEKKKHHYKFIYNNDFCFIRSDEKLLRQVFTNLLSNAAKYSPHSSEIIVELNENLHYVHFKVTDNGIGIRAEDQEYLFQPFHRGKNVGTVSGTGLGLSIVKRCIELMKGEISFESSINGTTFFLKIPKDIQKN